MFDVAQSLLSALGSSRDGLSAAAESTAVSQTRFGASRTDRAMAAVAQEAVFTEALLNALHSRLEEIKNVTR